MKLVISNLVNRLFITYDNKPKALQKYVVMHAHLILVSNLNHTYILKGMAPVQVKLGLGLYENNLQGSVIFHRALNNVAYTTTVHYVLSTHYYTDQDT